MTIRRWQYDWDNNCSRMIEVSESNCQVQAGDAVVVTADVQSEGESQVDSGTVVVQNLRSALINNRPAGLRLRMILAASRQS